MDPGAPRQLLDDLRGWLRERKAAELVTRDEAGQLVRDLRQDEAFWTRLRPRFEDAWKRGEERLRAEKRALKDVLSPDAQRRLLEAAEAFEPDPEAVRTFLRSPAIEATLGQVLYTGIYEFIKKVDMLGALINRMPVIGPIRKKVMAMFEEEVATRLEGQIKQFLGGFSGKAVERMIQSVLSDENREGFKKAQRKLAEHLLQRPAASLLPDPATTARWREAVWSGLRETTLKDEAAGLDLIYQDHGDATVGAWVWEGSPLAHDLFARAFARFLGEKGWRVER
jgi:hypothetical protein